MSRQSQLVEELNGVDKTWVSGIAMLNVPSIMLENDYIRSICALANAALLQCLQTNEYVLSTYDISQNK